MPAQARVVGADPWRRPELFVAAGATGGLVGLGIGLLELAAAGAVLAATGAGVWLRGRLRTRRLSARLAWAIAGRERPLMFGCLVDAFEEAWPLEFALLVGWAEDGVGCSVELQRGDSDVPEAELTSWLLRQAESGVDLVSDDGSQLARAGYAIALPLRRENSSLVGFLVLGGPGHPPAHVVAAARQSLDRIGLALAAPPARPERRLAAVR